MADVTFRTAPEASLASDVESHVEGTIKNPNDPTAEQITFDYVDPKESDSVILRAIGIDDEVSNLPDKDREDLAEVKQFIGDMVKTRGLKLEAESYKKVLDDLRYDMDLDLNMEPSLVLDKVAGVIKSWRGLVFVKDPREKRKIFMKLAKLPDSKSMNSAIFEEMEKYNVWNL